MIFQPPGHCIWLNVVWLQLAHRLDSFTPATAPPQGGDGTGCCLQRLPRSLGKEPSGFTALLLSIRVHRREGWHVYPMQNIVYITNIYIYVCMLYIYMRISIRHLCLHPRKPVSTVMLVVSRATKKWKMTPEIFLEDVFLHLANWECPCRLVTASSCKKEGNVINSQSNAASGIRQPKSGTAARVKLPPCRPAGSAS